MENQFFTRKHLLVVTLFLVSFIGSTAVGFFLFREKELLGIMAIFVVTIDLLYIIRLFDFPTISHRERSKWIVAILFFSVLAVPFFWRRFMK